MAEAERERSTRMIFMGDDSLADGFRLIGFETYPNPAADEVDRLLHGLASGQENALVLLDDALMQAEIPAVQRALDEGGRVLVVAIPRLQDPPRLASEVAERLEAMFGNALEQGRSL